MSREKRRPATLADLPFPRHRAVRWFSPRQLLQTSKYVALSAVFGAYADKREVQATATTPPYHDHSDGQEIWVDYVSDIGDGFDATYSVAYLLARPKLDVQTASGAETLVTSRGGLLVMGGDEVYPSASAQSYEERTKGPYNAALPHADDPPSLFAIPGNHDWYDGLTSFLRFFCQGQWVGGWQTEQRRSYFAVKLPQRWWLLGIDIQFDTYIDAPQIAYFRTVAEEIHDGDGIILCTAKPSWVDGGGNRPEAYATLDYFVAVVLGKDPQQVRLMLAGDAHHYARYTEIGGTRSLVTCGGGGAYLSATHGAPDPLTIPPETLHSDKVEPPKPARFDLRRTYPPQQVSRRLSRRVFDRLPRRNPGFVALMAGAQALLAYVFVASLRRAGQTLGDTWRFLEPSTSAVSALRQPAVLLAAVLAVWSATLFYRRGKAKGSIGGAAHGLAHLAVAVGTVWLVATLPIGSSWPDWLAFLTMLTCAAVVGGLAATLLVATYLYVTGARGIHLNELFSSQSIEDHKSFLRLHIGPDGALTMLPLAVPRVCRSWRVPPAVDAGTPWIEPAEPLTPVLVEPPVVIPREPAR